MFDIDVTLPKLKTLHPAVKDDAIAIFEDIDKAGIHARCVYGLRTFEEQKTLYDLGRDVPGKIVTNAKPGYSFHNYGLAFDFCLLHNDKTWSWDTVEDMDKDGVSDWLEIIAICEKHGWECGYRWTQFFDGPHVQKVFGYKVEQCLNMRTQGLVDANGYILIANEYGYGGHQ